MRMQKLPPVELDPCEAPEWMRQLPSSALDPHRRDRALVLENELRRQGLPAPTLQHLECERARRGMRTAQGVRRQSATKPSPANSHQRTKGDTGA